MKTSQPATRAPDTIGVTLAMAALFVLVAFGDDYPWHALTATGALMLIWLLITGVKRWWKSGTTTFAAIMDKELNR